jgi:hypothetical protein
LIKGDEILHFVQNDNVGKRRGGLFFLRGVAPLFDTRPGGGEKEGHKYPTVAWVEADLLELNAGIT